VHCSSGPIDAYFIEDSACHCYCTTPVSNVTSSVCSLDRSFKPLPRARRHPSKGLETGHRRNFQTSIDYKAFLLPAFLALHHWRVWVGLSRSPSLDPLNCSFLKPRLWKSTRPLTRSTTLAWLFLLPTSPANSCDEETLGQDTLFGGFTSFPVVLEGDLDSQPSGLTSTQGPLITVVPGQP